MKSKAPSLQLNDEDEFKNARVIKRDNKFVVLVEVASGEKTTPLEVGQIDLAKGQCQFNDESELLTKRLLNPFFRTCLKLFLSQRRGFLLHSCGVVKNGCAYIFAGAPRSGKSTVGRLSSDFTVLSDELICIREYPDSYRVYGTPWYGKDKDRSAVIKRIFFLRQANRTRFEAVSPGKAASEILSHIYCSTLDFGVITDLLSITAGLVSKVSCGFLDFSLTEPLWESIDRLEADVNQEVEVCL